MARNKCKLPPRYIFPVCFPEEGTALERFYKPNKRKMNEFSFYDKIFLSNGDRNCINLNLILRDLTYL